MNLNDEGNCEKKIREKLIRDGKMWEFKFSLLQTFKELENCGVKKKLCKIFYIRCNILC